MQAPMKWDFAVLIASFLLGAWLQSEYLFTTHRERGTYFGYCFLSFVCLCSKGDSVSHDMFKAGT